MSHLKIKLGMFCESCLFVYCFSFLSTSTTLAGTFFKPACGDFVEGGERSLSPEFGLIYCFYRGNWMLPGGWACCGHLCLDDHLPASPATRGPACIPMSSNGSPL